MTEDENTTTDESVRYKYLGSFLAGVMVISVPAVLFAAGAGAISLSLIGQGLFGLYATVALMAAVWAFGEDVLAAVRNSD